MNSVTDAGAQERAVRVPAGTMTLEGRLTVPDRSRGIVVCAHASGSSRHSPQNRHIARALGRCGLATLLIDLLTLDEEAADVRTAHLRFDIRFLANRFATVTDWLVSQADTRDLRIGYLTARTGSAAALVAAAERPSVIGAIVSREGRLDLAADALPRVEAPTLIILDERDAPIIRWNREALARLRAVATLEIVPGARDLLEQSGALEQVTKLARQWFERYLALG